MLWLVAYSEGHGLTLESTIGKGTVILPCISTNTFQMNVNLRACICPESPFLTFRDIPRGGATAYLPEYLPRLFLHLCHDAQYFGGTHFKDKMEATVDAWR